MRNKHYPIFKSSERLGFLETGLLYKFVSDRGFSKVEHSHDFFEILFLFSGRVNHIVNGTEYEMHNGDLFLLRPGDVHLPIRKSQQILACMLSVLPEYVIPMFEAYGIEKGVKQKHNGYLLTMNGKQQESFLLALKQMSVQGNLRKIDETRIILGQICENILVARREVQENWFDNILNQINVPERMKLGVKGIEEVANLSHAQLYRVFMKQLGQSPHQFLNALRMSYAYEAICSTDTPFESIAVSIGYDSFSYFSQLFKKTYGITPSALRKSIKKYW